MSGPGGGTPPHVPQRPSSPHPLDLHHHHHRVRRLPTSSPSRKLTSAGGQPPPPPLLLPPHPSNSSLQHQVGELEARAANMRTVLSQLVDADKDVDTEGNVSDNLGNFVINGGGGKNNLPNGGGGGKNNLPNGGKVDSNCDSPPPLPSLIFESQLNNASAFLGNGDAIINQSAFHRTGSPHPLHGGASVLSGVVLNDNFPDLNDNLTTSGRNSSISINEFIDNVDYADFNSNTDYGSGDLRYSSPHTSRPISRASSQASLSSLTSSTASSLSHLPRRSHSTHTPTRGSRRSLRQTRSASRSNRSNSFCGFNLPGGLSTSSINLDSQEDVANLIVTLRKERSRLLQEIEAEEEERAWFYSQLENLNQQLRRCNTGENVSTYVKVKSL